MLIIKVNNTTCLNGVLSELKFVWKLKLNFINYLKDFGNLFCFASEICIVWEREGLCKSVFMQFKFVMCVKFFNIVISVNSLVLLVHLF